jgi:hypothetical protein
MLYDLIMLIYTCGVLYSLCCYGLRIETCSAVAKKKMLHVRRYLANPDSVTMQRMQNTTFIKKNV